MDDWGWQELEPWLVARGALPIGPLFCILNGRTRGRPWSTSGARAELRRAAARAGVRRRFAPHQLRHAHAVEMAREGVPLIVIQRQLGHSNLGITSVYLQGIDNAEIIENGPRPPRPDDPGQRVAPKLAAGDARSPAFWTETFLRGLALARDRSSRKPAGPQRSDAWIAAVRPLAVTAATAVLTSVGRSAMRWIIRLPCHP